MKARIRLRLSEEGGGSNRSEDAVCQNELSGSCLEYNPTCLLTTRRQTHGALRVTTLTLCLPLMRATTACEATDTSPVLSDRNAVTREGARHPCPIA